MKDYDKIKESSYLNYWNVNNLHGWAMSQKLPLGSFKGVEYTSQFSKDFIESYNEDSDEEYFLEVGVQFLEELHELHNDLPFLPEKIKIEKVEPTCLIRNLNKINKKFIHIRNLE